MKKFFTLLIALTAFSAVFAQSKMSYNNHSSNNWNTPVDNRIYNDNDGYYNDRPDHAIVITNDNKRYQKNNHYNDYDRRAEVERINRDYDRRINDYRNNRRLNAYERNRSIQMAEKERSDKLKAFGGGVLLGGILGVLIGSNL
jgi:hypothetical protein